MRTNFGSGFLVLLASAVLGMSLMAAGPARADPRPGALRLSTDVPVMALNHFPEADLETMFQFGIWGGSPFSGLPLVGDASGPIPLVGLGLGYQATGTIVIGARLGFGVALIDSDNPFTDDIEAGVIALLPFFEYLFLEGTVRPFVGAQAGFQIFFPEDFDRRDAMGIFIAGGLGGLHIFAADGFSISPTLFFDFLYRGSDKNAGFEMILALSLDGWIG